MNYLESFLDAISLTDPVEVNASIEPIPIDVIRIIAKQLPFTSIIRLCRTSRKFNNAVCNYDPFWKDLAKELLTDNVDNLEVADIKKALYLIEAIDKDYIMRLKEHWLGKYAPFDYMYVDVKNVTREDGKVIAEYYLAKDGYDKFIRHRLRQLSKMKADDIINDEMHPQYRTDAIFWGAFASRRYQLAREAFQYLSAALKLKTMDTLVQRQFITEPVGEILTEEQELLVEEAEFTTTLLPYLTEEQINDINTRYPGAIEWDEVVE